MHPAMLVATDSTSHVHLVIGSNPLAGARCTRSLEAGAKPKLIAPVDATLHYGLAKRIEDGEVEWIQREFVEEDLHYLGREEVNGVVDAVFVTSGRTSSLNSHISKLCRKMRIPVNVVDAPSLCTFTLLSTYTDGPLQIGVTTSGKGCKLASRIRREIASSLPSNLGQAVERLGGMRRRIYEEDHAAELAADVDADDDDTGQTASFNKLVTPEDAEAARTRRIRWLAQICEYWPLGRLASITDADVEAVLHSYLVSESAGLQPSTLDARRERLGRIVLAGSGPGDPDLLTAATHKAILAADLILADKLVPAAVLALVPRRTPIHIARKFPGNADRAQDELLALGLAAAREGKTVVRLKQGDPYLYGRGGEEFSFFAAHGYVPVVLPGITSALAAPLLARVPLTHRAVADQVLVCTGTGRAGASPDPPAYREATTAVFLMALHRLGALVESLVGGGGGDGKEANGAGRGAGWRAWPPDTPCAVVERASCPDQRVIRSTLEHIAAAVEEEGSRPPGLLVVGRACGVLMAEAERGRRWLVEEGFAGFADLGRGGAEALRALERERERETGQGGKGVEVAVA